MCYTANLHVFAWGLTDFEFACNNA